MGLLNLLNLRAAMLALLALSAPTAARAHGTLRSSVPAHGAHLSVAPSELRLTFTEAPELAFSRVTLVGPDGQAVSLGDLRRARDPATIVSAIIDPLVSGAYTVRWQMAGADGHPVRGEFSFTIAPGAAGLTMPTTVPGEAGGGVTAPGQQASPDAHHPVATPGGPGFDASSWPYSVVRWLTFTVLLGAIGAVAFRFAVLGALRRQGSTSLFEPAASTAARIATWLAALLLVVAVARLYAQSLAMHGSERALDAGLVAAMLGGTVWGWAWLLQVAAAVVAFVSFRAAGRRSGAWIIAAIAAVALAFTPALAGHAVSVPRLRSLVVFADAAHVIGAAGWLGSLFMVIAAGVPAALRLEADARGPAVKDLVNAFSPTALLFAGITAASGVFAAWIHLGSVPALWTSDYGRTLLVKLGILSIVAGTGAYNWLRVRPSLGDVEGARRLRLSSLVELGVAVVVIAVTAVLVATPTPMDQP